MEKLKVGIARNEKKLDKPLTKRGIKIYLKQIVNKTFKSGNVSKEFWLVAQDDNKIVAITGNGPNSQKNAYRIAALPDLYNACKQSLDFLYRIHIMEEDHKIEAEKIKSKIIDAINKYNFWE